MQLNKLFKGLFIAIPVVTMMACSSTDEAKISEAEANKAATEQAAMDMKKQQQQEEASRKAIAAKASAAKDMEMQETRNELTKMRNDSTVYFEFDTAKLNADAYDLLAMHASFLAKNPRQRIVVEGHCDSRGTPEYNIALGERRAKGVETFLLNSGVSSSQVSVVSYGEEKPVVSGSTESAFSKNRRGVLVYQ